MKYLPLIVVLAIHLGLPAAQAGSVPLELFAVSDLDRIFEDGYGAPQSSQGPLKWFGLRNEIISGQCVILAQEDVADLQLSLSTVQQSDSTSVIPASNVEWNFIDSIFIEKNSPNRQRGGLLRPAPARFPDVLSADRKCSLRKGTRKAVYLTLAIPPDAAPGEYRGSVTAKAGPATASLAIVLQVYPLVLPQERHLYVTEWFSTSQFRKHQQLDPSDSEGFYRLLKLYAENMAGHRQNVFRFGLGPIESRRNAQGRLEFDFSRFDKMAQVFWDTGRMDLLETGFIARFGKGGWSGNQIVLENFRVMQPDGKQISIPGEQFLPEFLPAFASHLRAKGWLQKTVFHIADEPSDHNIVSWRNASDFVHRLAPEFRRIDAIETPHCLGSLEVWVPKLDHLATWQSAYEEAQRHGNELWFYTVGIFQGGSLLNKTVDVPLIETRLMHWLNYRYNLRGYLHWGFNEWTDDPINAPGEHRGDGWHVYPAKEGLLNSLRWEQMRNGLQDYECLWLLENRIAQIKESLPPRVASLINPRQRGLEICSQVVADYYNHATNSEVLYRAKRQAIEETLALDQAPRVLLQTFPLEHSALGRGCAVDLHGWTDPGTALTANGESVPVQPDGLFLAQVSPSSDGKIAVVAHGTNGSKSILRQFQLK